MLTCAEIARLVTDYVENRLAPEERRRFEEHVAICPPCRGYLGQMRHTVGLAGELTEEDIPPDLERHLLEAFRDWKRAG